ncbi:MAG: AMP-binding protein [Natronospirillum sp.]|uniref:phenylacetate--CoA ligase family protein n=1 Tax=Natronospirillum sp. TaxID=2812955 RepID=UPI0025EB0A65|nr:AMP-binding protein [Natronospirillum sp.]MCH8552379.1 AMP-binding protein [Natronospirillum sp.]
MEEWKFPPSYSNDYFPDPKSPYWFRERETMDPAKRDELIVARLRDVMAYAYDHSPFYQRKWDEAGIKAEDIRSLADFEQVPVVHKQEIRDAQAEHPPFGDYLCCPESNIYHIHGTSGTTGRPTAFGISRSDWDAIANNHARIMWGMGLRPGDTVFVGALLSLYMGSWGALIGAERLGCKAFPFGAGAPGMTARAVTWLQMMKPAGFYSTPSYALRLAEVAREEGVDPKAFGIRVMFFSGEPGGSIPSIRDKIQELYGAKVVDSGTMAEMTPWMHAAGSADSEGMLLWQDIVYTEVADPDTHRRVPYGEQGTPIYTHLERTSQPMIRMLSGDLTHWVMDDNPCGRTYPRLPKGIYGRIDDMFQIRGENVYPSAIAEILEGLDGYGGEHRIIISRDGSMDELAVKAEFNQVIAEQGQDAVRSLREKAETALSRVLGVRARVIMVEPETFPRTDFKAQRVVDDRDLYQSLNQKRGG